MVDSGVGVALASRVCVRIATATPACSVFKFLLLVIVCAVPELPGGRRKASKTTENAKQGGAKPTLERDLDIAASGAGLIESGTVCHMFGGAILDDSTRRSDSDSESSDGSVQYDVRSTIQVDSRVVHE